MDTWEELDELYMKLTDPACDLAATLTPWRAARLIERIGQADQLLEGYALVMEAVSDYLGAATLEERKAAFQAMALRLAEARAAARRICAEVEQARLSDVMERTMRENRRPPEAA